MGRAPYVNRKIQGIRRSKWRICPYAECDQSNRIPAGERTPHTVTSGYMAVDIRGGHDRAGWRCDDPGCPYFLGTAVTPIIIRARVTRVDQTTGEHNVDIEEYEVPMGCSGIKFWEM